VPRSTASAGSSPNGCSAGSSGHRCGPSVPGGQTGPFRSVHRRWHGYAGIRASRATAAPASRLRDANGVCSDSLVQRRTVGTGEYQVLGAVVGRAALQFTQGGDHGGAQRDVTAPSIGLHRAELPAVVVLANSQAEGRQNLTTDDD